MISSKHFIILFVATVIAINVTDAKPSKGRIIGGDNITINEAPYQVAILQDGNMWCGGSILSSNYILTAGHCFRYFSIENETDVNVTIQTLRVRVGATTFANGGQVVSIDEIYIHPRYLALEFFYDVAIAKVKPPLNLGPKFNTTPVELPPNSNWVAGDPVTVSGWGVTVVGSNITSPTLKKANMTLRARDDCNNVFVDPLMDYMLCIGQEDTTPCFGDSGGPVVRRNSRLLLGTMSRVRWGDCRIFPSVSIDVGHPEIRQFVANITRI